MTNQSCSPPHVDIWIACLERLLTFLRTYLQPAQLPPFYFLTSRPPPRSTLFPYTTLFRSECLIQLTKLGYDATPFNQILKQNAKREMRLRLGKVTVADVLAAQPVTTNLLKFMRASIKMIGVSNLQSFIASMTQKLTL